MKHFLKLRQDHLRCG